MVFGSGILRFGGRWRIGFVGLEGGGVKREMEERRRDECHLRCIWLLIADEMK